TYGTPGLDATLRKTHRVKRYRYLRKRRKPFRGFKMTYQPSSIIISCLRHFYKKALIIPVPYAP
ncbi:MAG: hypothetical protein LH609_08080, partial [Rudanella sp.]|nr:hypothetical protein [Rudanella sp.]